jgi:hypothetical protein
MLIKTIRSDFCCLINIKQPDFTISGLTPEKTYYLRAYATNELGTGYGNEITFKTTPAGTAVTDIDGNVYSSIIIGDQIWMKQNLKSTRYSNGDLIGTTTPAN